MDKIDTLDRFTCPYGGQDVELQQVQYASGGIPLLRLRIRERGARFTIFEVDAETAKRWGKAMIEWGEAQPKE